MSRVVVADHHANPEDRQAATADLSWMLWTAVGIGGIWVAVLLLSLLAPDLVSGSEQDHLRWPRSRPGSGAGSAPSSSCG